MKRKTGILFLFREIISFLLAAEKPILYENAEVKVSMKIFLFVKDFVSRRIIHLDLSKFHLIFL